MTGLFVPYDITKAFSCQTPRLGPASAQASLLFTVPVIFAPDHPPPVDENDPLTSVSAACASLAPKNRGNRARISTKPMRNNFLIHSPPYTDYVC